MGYMNGDGKQNIKLIIRQREKVIFEGEVKAFTSYNGKGVFDIIPEHANFVSLINSSFVIHKTDGQNSETKFEEGIVRVRHNTVNVYLGIGK